MKNTLLLIFALLTTSYSFSQKSDAKVEYYKDGKNIIYNEQEHTDLKKEIVSEFKKVNQIVKVIENFGEVEQIGDSLIQNYEFSIRPLLADGQVKINSAPKFGKHLINQKLPNASLKNIDGSSLNLNSLDGKPTMINFWFTSCRPCIDEFPALNKIKEKYSDKVNFISITFDDKEKVDKLIEKFTFDFDMYIDAKEYINDLDIQAYPASLFIDKNGVVKYAEGGIPFIIKNGKKNIGDGAEFETIINELLE